MNAVDRAAGQFDRVLPKPKKTLMNIWRKVLILTSTLGTFDHRTTWCCRTTFTNAHSRAAALVPSRSANCYFLATGGGELHIHTQVSRMIGRRLKQGVKTYFMKKKLSHHMYMRNSTGYIQ